MERRAFLAATCCAVGGSVTGCLDRQADAGSTNRTASSNDTVSGEHEEIVVEDVVVRKAVTYEQTMGSGGVLVPAGEQFVVASVRGDERPDQQSFSFETEASSRAPVIRTEYGYRSVAGRSRSRDSTYLAFRVPSPLEPSNPRIEYAGTDAAEWPLPSRQRDRLAAPEPRFELKALSVPDEVSQGDPLPVSLTVRNVSETVGRLVVAVRWPTRVVADDDESREVGRRVDAGDRETLEFEFDTRGTAFEDGPATLSVEGHVAAQRDVQVVDVPEDGFRSPAR